MAKAHEELKKLLGERPGKAFALDVTRQVYAWAERIPDDAIRYRIFEELTVRYEQGRKPNVVLTNKTITVSIACSSSSLVIVPSIRTSASRSAEN